MCLDDSCLEVFLDSESRIVSVFTYFDAFYDIGEHLELCVSFLVPQRRLDFEFLLRIAKQ